MTVSALRAEERPAPLATKLALPTALLVAVASLAGIAWPALYAAENAFVRPQLVAQDLFNLVVACPLLLSSRPRRGRPCSFQRAFLQLGTFAYLAYSYAVYAFDVRHNAMFLAYVALLSISTYALVAGTLALPRRGLREAFAPAPVRLVGAFAVVVGALFALVWLADIVSSLVAGRPPLVVSRYDIPTFSVYVIDLGFVLPSLLWGGWYTFRRDPSGYVVCAITLVLTALMMAQLAFGNVWFGVVTGAMDWAFFGLFAALATSATALLLVSASRARHGAPRFSQSSRVPARDSRRTSS